MSPGLELEAAKKIAAGSIAKIRRELKGDPRAKRSPLESTLLHWPEACHILGYHDSNNNPRLVGC